MADLEVLDPLGRTVRFEGKVWFGHIIEAHPDMKPYRRLVASALAGRSR